MHVYLPGTVGFGEAFRNRTNTAKAKPATTARMMTAIPDTLDGFPATAAVPFRNGRRLSDGMFAICELVEAVENRERE